MIPAITEKLKGLSEIKKTKRILRRLMKLLFWGAEIIK
jgi:hypothetical protein